MNQQHKVAVITGAGTGIGKATLELLRSEGALVYNLDYKSPEADDPYFIACDVRKKEDIQHAIRIIHEKEKRIDYLFANAGVHLFASIEETSYEQLESIVATNILGVFYLLKAVLPIMREQQKGSIVLMGSDQAFEDRKSVV